MTEVTTVEPPRWGGKTMPGQDELPYSNGEPVESSFHLAQPALLIDTLQEAWADRGDFYVAGNMFVYFSELQVKNNDFRGPDVFVTLDTDRKPRKSWVSWEEGGRLPDTVVEVTSESTENIDRGDKMRIYSRIWRTPGYFIFEPQSSKLEGYRLDVDRLSYVPIIPDARGDLPVPRLGLSLGTRPTRYREFDRPFLRWIDMQGNALPTAQERVRELEAQLNTR